MKTIESMFDSSGMHDTEDMKRIILEGSKIGKDIIKKENQLQKTKELLSSVDEHSSTEKIKQTLINMYKIYEKGNALDNKVGRIRTDDNIALLGMCYNYTAGKMETIKILKDNFDSEVQGY